jgi:hypothetical protein
MQTECSAKKVLAKELKAWGSRSHDMDAWAKYEVQERNSAAMLKVKSRDECE